jgi:predicted acylesterase/phospholipase RssA
MSQYQEKNAMSTKTTRRGFVMTGGGAKGLYEAGVIHAFHLCGMEFDVITGSSIGAINAIAYAEYQYLKRQLSTTIRDDPEKALEAMDAFVKEYHDTWRRLPDFQIIDDSETGPLGMLKSDLLRFDISLPQIVRLVWWWTDPTENKWLRPAPRVWLSLALLLKEAVERLGSGCEFLRIWGRSRRTQRSLLGIFLRAYLARFNLEHAIVPDEGSHRLQELFSAIVDPNRTLRDYADAGIDVRLTRANYRTGRLEISMYQSPVGFVRYLAGHAWHLEKNWNRIAPLGSSRLQMVGNPNAIGAAIASGRFPGVFAPFPIWQIYQLNKESPGPENELLNSILQGWMDKPQVEESLYTAYRTMHPDWSEQKAKRQWAQVFSAWRDSGILRQLFPHANDTYVDGGAIDNTPTNSAIDATREWTNETGTSRRDVVLDLYTIFLDPPATPQIESHESEPALYEVVQRTLAIQSAAKLPSDAVVVRTINTFGQRAERLGQTADQLYSGLAALLDELHNDLPIEWTAEQKQAVMTAVQQRVVVGMGLAAEGGDDIRPALEKIKGSTDSTMSGRLPIHVEPVEIYPDTMPMGTLNFTKRLGFRDEDAVQMLTVGCYQALWTLRAHLEGKQMECAQKGATLEATDLHALHLARKWMGFEDWPEDVAQRQSVWRCQRTACAYYNSVCHHGRPGR